MSHFYNIVASPVKPSPANRLASLALNLAQGGTAALEQSSQPAVSAAPTVVVLEEFLGDARVGRLFDVLGLTHSGTARLVASRETDSLAERASTDRRRAKLPLTPLGRYRAAITRAARDAVVRQTTGDLNANEASTLESPLAQLV